MKSYICSNLPIKIEITNEIVNLLAEAMGKYGEYLGLLSVINVNRNYLLNTFAKIDSYKSTQIEGTQVSETEMLSVIYKKQNDDVKEILNYHDAYLFGKESIKEGTLNINQLNEMHAILLDSVRGSNKNPGEIRKIQNWIGPRGVGIEKATFVPPAPSDVPHLLENLLQYINIGCDLPDLIQIAIMHAQFETIHPYNDGNGRLGRLLIPLHQALVTKDEPILFLSEIIEQYKMAYARALSDYREKPEKFIIFFLQCVIDQCTAYIYRIERTNEIIRANNLKITECFGTKSASIIHNIFAENIVIKVSDIVSKSNIHIQTVRSTIKELIKIGIIEKRKGSTEYVYKELYDIFIHSN